MLRVTILALFISCSWGANQFRPTRDFGFNPRIYNATVLASELRIHITTTYLEVEEEVLLEATLSPNFIGDDNSIELFGSFQLPEGSIIRSSILWFGEDILKGKLMDTRLARELYEDVVQRDEMIIIPRDPSLIEKTSANGYAYSIYPVELGGTRRMRVRYDIPIQKSDTVKIADLASIFNSSQDLRMNVNITSEIPETIKLKTRDQIFTVTPGSSYSLERRNLLWYNGSARFFIKDTSSNLMRSHHVIKGPLEGYYHDVTIPVPDSLNSIVDSNWASVTCQLKLNNTEVTQIVNVDKDYLQNNKTLRLFIRTEYPWEGHFEWVVFDELGELKGSVEVEVDSSDIADRAVVNLWAHHQEQKLGHLLGYVDENMSLLALEKDTLSDSLVEKYWDEGVPLLKSYEIYSNTDEIAELGEINVVVLDQEVIGDDLTTALLGSTIEKFLNWQILDNTLLVTLQGESLVGARVTAYNLQGQLLKTQQLQAGENQFQLPELARSQYVVVIEYSQNRYTVPF